MHSLDVRQGMGIALGGFAHFRPTPDLSPAR